MPLLISIIAAILVIYGFLFLYLVLFQKKFIYFPSKVSFNECRAFSGYEKITYKGTQFFLKEKGKNDRLEFFPRDIKFVICFFDNAVFKGGWFEKEALITLYLKLLTESILYNSG